jgi:hypothetical protein
LDSITVEASKVSFTIGDEIGISSNTTEDAIQIDSSIETPAEGNIDYVNTHYTKEFRNLHNEWGTSSADTHFINYFHSGSNNDFNTLHIEPRYHFYMIGDVEVYSGSNQRYVGDIVSQFTSSALYKADDDFTNFSRFYNRQQITYGLHKNIIYESFAGPSGSTDTSYYNNKGPQKGRALGKTRYFYTGSDGTITFPSNHVSRFNNPFTDVMYAGAQNTNPGILPVKEEDYSTASFYSVKVTGGENQLIIRKPGNPGDDIRIEKGPNITM